MEFSHKPVLLEETLKALAPAPGEYFVDCTLGGGGHSLAILELIAPDGVLLGLDQDEEAIAAASGRLKKFGSRFRAYKTNFENMDVAAGEMLDRAPDGILMDIGVSSHQLDRGERGFSYMQDAPLDMRMDADSPLTAWNVINEFSGEELHDIIRRYGEERWAARIAAFIVEERREKTIDTTFELNEVIKKAIPARARRNGPHPSKRTFQAVRIAVNRELDVLEKSLDKAFGMLAPGGRLAVITFHSLEDRIVKEKFRYYAADCVCPPGMPVCTCGKVREAEIITRKPVTPTEKETEENPRARSAKLRAVRKLETGGDHVSG